MTDLLVMLTFSNLVISSTKDLIKAINGHVSSATLPLPDELSDIIESYLEKHEPIDENESQRLHDELLVIYLKDIQDQPDRYAVFLAILRHLRPAVDGYERLLKWWDLLVLPVLDHLGDKKGLAVETRSILLTILAYDTDDASKQEEAQKTSSVLTSRLLEMWLKKSGTPGADAATQFLAHQLQIVLLDYGRKRPKELLTAMNKFFVQKKYRSQTLSLLGEFIRHGPPHLHHLLETSLWPNLLKCLEIDTSTTVISLSMTVLVMLLPHIPNSSVKYLPNLFKIYSRLLFWERERGPSITEVAELEKASDTDSDSDEAWEKLQYSSDFDEEMVPEILTFFTFLYGLYPINFMSYIRKPERYLRHANYDDQDDMDVQPSEVRQRSEPFRRLHLLHPNFFTMTLKSEVNDPNRWMKSEAADVTAACMALYCGPPDSLELPSASSRTSRVMLQSTGEAGTTYSPSNPISEKNDKEALLSQEAVEADEGMRTSWRNTNTTLVAPTEEDVPQQARSDSPTLPAHMMSAEPNDITLDPTTTTDEKNKRIDGFMRSLSRSPSLRPSTGDASADIMLLHREIMLLKNDLNFERYLKQQHLSHIGQLRTRHVREATVEAETQNLINVNRGLKSKLEEAKNTTAQIRRDAEKSRAHAKKWEADITTKLRALKEEQKKWLLESENLNRELAVAKDNIFHMRQMIVASEAKELASQQKMQSIEANYEKLDSLQREVEKLRTSVRTYEAREVKFEDANTARELAESKIQTLELELAAQRSEASQLRLQNEREIERLRLQIETIREDTEREQSASFQPAIDNALVALRGRLVETQKAHAHLLKRFTAIEAQYQALKETHESDEPLLGGGGGFFDSSHPTTPTTPYSPGFSGQRRIHSSGRVSTIGGIHSPAVRAVEGQGRQGSFDSLTGAGSDAEGRPKVQPQSEVRVYGRGEFDLKSVRGRGMWMVRGGLVGNSLTLEILGGVQNIGANKKKKEDKEAKKAEGKDKKGTGLRGIRGFVS